MRKLLTIPALLLALCLLAACGGQVEPVTAAETTAELTTTTEAESTTEAIPEPTQQSTNDLLDFALIDRLFSMTLTDYFREEGGEKEPVDIFEGGPFYSFSKYDSDSYFFFGGDDDRPSSMALEAQDVLVGRPSLTLGELKQWLSENEIKYNMREQTDEDSPSCIFTVGDYTIFTFMENESTSDNAAVRRFFVKPKD